MLEIKKVLKKLDLATLKTQHKEIANYLQTCKFEKETLATCASINNDDICIYFGRGFININDNNNNNVGIYAYEGGKHKLYLNLFEIKEVVSFTNFLNKKKESN